MPFSEEKIKAIVADPNSFHPNDIRNLMIEVELTSEQEEALEKYAWDNPHRKAYEEGKLLKKEPHEYEHCMSDKASFEDLEVYVGKYEKFTASYEAIEAHYQEVYALLKGKQEEEALFDALKKRIEELPDNASKLDAVHHFEREHPKAAVAFRKELDALLAPIEAEERKKEQERAEEERKRKEQEREAEEYEKLMDEVRTCATFSEKIAAINAFMNDHPFTIYKEAIEELKEQLEESADIARKAADERAWQNVLSVLASPADSNFKKQKLNEYSQNYTLHREEVPQKLKEVEEESKVMPTINSILGNPDSDVIDFIRLISKYPSKKKLICDFMLKDMGENPARYDRVEMNWLLKGKNDVVDQIAPVFTPDEIVNSGVLPWKVINHIMNHPRDEDDRNPAESSIRPETNFDSALNNTDVYFFGVPGSGKSTVLAGLLNVKIYGNLRLGVLTHGGHSGYNYATVLMRYLQDNLFPQSTKTRFSTGRTNALVNPFTDENDEMTDAEDENVGDKFIQIIDAELINDETNEKHRLSIIEMPGERTLDFAAANVKDIEEMDRLLGKGTRQLFMNDNRKVFFFVIDPNPKRNYILPLNGQQVSVTQEGALDALVQFVRNVPGLLSKVDAVHIILSKSDTLKDSNNFSNIQEEVLNDYAGFIRGARQLCDPALGNVNAQCGRSPHLFTFSLGKIYPGNMNEYKKDDAAKLLEVIAANTWSTSSMPSKWESWVEFMNKGLFE